MVVDLHVGREVEHEGETVAARDKIEAESSTAGDWTLQMLVVSCASEQLMKVAIAQLLALKLVSNWQVGTVDD